MKLFRSFKNTDFRKDERGSATLEAVLWLPVFISFMVLAADASFIFFGQNQAYRVVQDANRNLSIGRLQSEEEVVDYVVERLASISPNATVTAVIDGGIIASVAKIPVTDLMATSFFSAFLDLELTVGARHFVEY